MFGLRMKMILFQVLLAFAISLSVTSCGGGGGDGDTSSGGGTETLNLAGNWSGTFHSNTAGLDGALALTLKQTGNQVTGTAWVKFPSPYVSCLNPSTVNGTVSGNTAQLSLKANNGTEAVVEGQGTSTHVTGTYRTTTVNVTLKCQPDIGTFDIWKQ